MFSLLTLFLLKNQKIIFQNSVENKVLSRRYRRSHDKKEKTEQLCDFLLKLRDNMLVKTYNFFFDYHMSDEFKNPIRNLLMFHLFCFCCYSYISKV